MKPFSRSFAGFRITKVGSIFSVSFRDRLRFIWVDGEWRFRMRPLSQAENWYMSYRAKQEAEKAKARS